MAKPISQTISNGDMQTQRENKKLHGSTQKPPHRSNKKTMKSNITNKMKTRRSGATVTINDDQDEDGNGESSGSEEQTKPAEEPDVQTLSGAQPDAVDGGRGGRYGGLE